ncbi:hypothetical protein ACFE04_020630 [Oxalis oulophora]
MKRQGHYAESYLDIRPTRMQLVGHTEKYDSKQYISSTHIPADTTQINCPDQVLNHNNVANLAATSRCLRKIKGGITRCGVVCHWGNNGSWNDIHPWGNNRRSFNVKLFLLETPCNSWYSSKLEIHELNENYMVQQVIH